MVRCELSDLPVEQCGCRNHRPALDTAPTPRRPGRIDARYDGVCPCGERFAAGDPIRMIGRTGPWGHDECADE